MEYFRKLDEATKTAILSKELLVMQKLKKKVSLLAVKDPTWNQINLKPLEPVPSRSYHFNNGEELVWLFTEPLLLSDPPSFVALYVKIDNFTITSDPTIVLGIAMTSRPMEIWTNIFESEKCFRFFERKDICIAVFRDIIESDFMDYRRNNDDGDPLSPKAADYYLHFLSELVHAARSGSSEDDIDMKIGDWIQEELGYPISRKDNILARKPFSTRLANFLITAFSYEKEFDDNPDENE